MNARRRRRRTIFGYLFAIAYAAWAFYYLPRVPQEERLFGTIGCSVFFMFYVVPFTVFAANIEIQDSGVRVEQYDARFLAFSQLRACFKIFLVPFRVAIVVTRERFPMNMLVVFEPDGNFVNALKSKVSGASVRRSI